MLKKKLVIATSNKGKLKEIAMLLREYEYFNQYDFVALPENTPIPEETADTFQGNAELKANYYFNLAKADCIADDSGFACEDLNGMPGIYSARWMNGNAETGIKKVLSMLHDVKDPTLNAYFASSLSIRTDRFTLTVLAKMKGKVCLEPRGVNGFGYDSIFIPDGYTQTFGEMSFDQKNSICHRAIAFKKLAEELKKV